jgi:uroporphyrinogen decarboxylase
MTHRERAIWALELKGEPPPGLVPTFELEFQLTEELLGRSFHAGDAWQGATAQQRDRLAADNAGLYLEVARRLDHAIIMETKAPTIDDLILSVRRLKEAAAGEYLVICHGDGTFAIPSGQDMVEQASWFFEHPDDAHARARQMVDDALARAERLMEAGCDGFALCADYCFNSGPFLSPGMFAEFVTPYLARLVEGQRAMGAYTIKHTDGDIMPILDQLVDCRPHALHSLDPMAGVDIAEVKRLIGDRVCLIGNVNCALLQTGTMAEIEENARYALRHGMPGGGYIYSTSNVAFKGLPLERYMKILEVRGRWGRYGPGPSDSSL